MRNNINASNILSVSRIFLTIPMAYCLFTDFPNNRLWTAGIILIAVSTDFLDGYIARKLHQVTELGKFIDPLADKICIGIYAICLAITKDLPIWFIVATLLRDVLIFSGGIYLHKTKRIIPQSNWPGKITVGFISAVFFLATLQISTLANLLEVLIWITTAMMLLSVIIYAKRLFIGRNINS